MSGVINLFFISIYIYLMSQYIVAGIENLFVKKTEYITYNILTVFGLMMFLNIFISVKSFIAIFTIHLFYVLSLAMYFVHEFRGTNLNYSDIKCIGTAKEVAGGYKYNINERFIITLVINIILTIVFIKSPIARNVFRKQTNTEAFEYFIRFMVSFVIILLKAIIVFFIYNIVRWKISASYYDYSLNSGENEGYIYNFTSSIPLFHKITIDEDDADIYENINFESLTEDSTKTSTKKNMPHIIVIMNESFGTVNRRVNTNEPVTPYYDSLEDVLKGDMFVNTFGGGTANTEFEFLTSVSVGNLPYPTMPYNSYVKKNKYSIARYLKSLGYKTIALHPYTATNYRRNKVYKFFGFDDLVFYNNFKHKDKIRKFVSDESMYQEIIERYENMKNSDEKIFMFGITMQNHSGYDRFIEQKIIALDDRENVSINSYLSLLKISDNALQKLVDYFKNVDEHVILCVFGDHNAGFGDKTNKKYYDMNDDYEGTNAYMTPYFIMDNKKKIDLENETTSANFLMNKILKIAKLPLDAWQKKVSEFNDRVEYMNYHKCKFKDVANMDYMDINLQEFLFYQREYLNS